jgi:acetyl esterase/lipase
MAGSTVVDRRVVVEARFKPAGGPNPDPAEVDCTTVANGCVLVVGSADLWAEAPIAFGAHGDGVRYRDRVFADVDVTHDVVYGNAVGDKGVPEDLKLDIYQPHGDTIAARPAIVYAHGGYFVFGDKGEGEQVGRELARRGYVVVSINYRLYAGGNYDLDRLGKAIPAAQHDAQAAVRWLRAQAGTYKLSPSAIGMIGYSAGAVTSLGVANHWDDPGDSGNPGYPSTIAGAVSLSGVAAGVTAGAPPVSMFHGDNDTTVPYASAVDSCNAAKAIGNRCDFITYPGIGHDIYSRYGDWMPRVVSFYGETVIPALDPATPPAGGSGPDAPEHAPPATPVVAVPHYTG